MSHPSSEPRAPDRRAEIAAAARALIAERGFEGLRTRDIAERVGINVATLHYHVPSKEALIQLVAQSVRDDFVAQNAARPAGPHTPLARMRFEFAEFRDNLVNNPALFTVHAELNERAKRDESVAACVRPMLGYWHGQWSALLAEGRDDGSFRPDLDARAAAAMVIGAMIGSQRMQGDRVQNFDAVAAELERALRNPLPPETQP